MYERDRHTHRHTHIPHDGIGRACIASRGNKTRTCVSHSLPDESVWWKFSSVSRKAALVYVIIYSFISP